MLEPSFRMLSSVALAATITLSPGAASRIDEIVHTVMREQHVAGLSLGIARRGRVLLLSGYGYRNVPSHAAADGYTIYRIGSITKQFTAALVLNEAQHGRIALDAPIGTYLAQLSAPDAAVTIRQLLAQTSGIASFTDPGATLESVLASAPAFTPGTAWQYSNTNYTLLGEILGSAGQRPYAELLERTIVAPLNLVSTSFALPAAQNVAAGYRWNGDGFAMVTPSVFDMPEYLGAAGAVSSNVPDLLRWLEALRNGRIAGAVGFQEMTTSRQLASGVRTGYGYGFFVHDWYGLSVAEHPGFLDGFSGDDAIVLDDGLEVAVLTNADRTDVVPLTKSIVAIVDGPKDANLYASAPRPPENENPAITALVRTIFGQLQKGTIDRNLLSPAYAATLSDEDLEADARLLNGCGSLTLAEFIERTRSEDLTFEKYRVTCDSRRFWMTLGLSEDERIGSLQIARDED
jgi:D-alanyl-D-alanine carboxypeptidase